MEYPPWLPKPEKSRQGMLLALARCTYELWYRPEMHNLKGEIWTFDNRCTPVLETVSSILERAGFTRYIDDFRRRSVFNCGPLNFERFAASAAFAPVSDQEISEAIVKLAAGSYCANLEVAKLAEMIAERP